MANNFGVPIDTWSLFDDLGFSLTSQPINVELRNDGKNVNVVGRDNEVIKAREYIDKVWQNIYKENVTFVNPACADLFLDEGKPNDVVIDYMKGVIEKHKKNVKYRIGIEAASEVNAFSTIKIYGRRQETAKYIADTVCRHIAYQSVILEFSEDRDFLDIWRLSKKLQTLTLFNSRADFVCTDDVLEDYFEMQRGQTSENIPVPPLIIQFLSTTTGEELLTQLQQELDIKINVDPEARCLDIRGNKDYIKQFKKELKRRLIRKSVSTELSKVDIDSYRQSLDDVVYGTSCCWEMKFATKPEGQKLDNCQYIATWSHPRSRKKITLVDGYPKDMNANSLILLVNDIRFPLHKEKHLWQGSISDIANSIHEHNDANLKVGTIDKLKVKDKLEYLIVIGQVHPKTKKENETCARLHEYFINIFDDHCKERMKSLLVPVSILEGYISTNDIIRSFIEATQSANEEYFANGMELYLCCNKEVCDVDVVKSQIDSFYEQLGPGFSRQNHMSSQMISKDRLQIKMKVVNGLLHESETDAIVNTTSASLDLTQGTASKQILQHAGHGIQTECSTKYPTGINQSEIAVTSSGQLRKCKHVFHGVLKHFSGPNNIKYVKMFVRRCLVEAELLKLTTIAFPALGTGRLEYPRRDVAMAMFDAVEEFEQETILPIRYVKTVKFVLFAGDKKTCDTFCGEEYRRTKKCIMKNNLPVQEQHGSSVIHGTMRYSSKAVQIQVLVDYDISDIPTNFVEIVLVTTTPKPDIKISSMNPYTILDQYEIGIGGMQNTQPTLRNPMEQCVKFCMEERVTGILLKTDYRLNLPEDTQVQYMTEGLQAALAKLESCYLKTVYIIVPDRPAFEKVRATLLASTLVGKLSLYFGLKNISMKESENATKDEMSIELVGSAQESVERVATKLMTILSTSQMHGNTTQPITKTPKAPDVPSHHYEKLGARPKTQHQTNRHSSQISDRLRHDAHSDTDFDSDQMKADPLTDDKPPVSESNDKIETQIEVIGSESMFDEVSAEINPMVLKGFMQNLNSWISEMKTKFEVKIGVKACNADTVIVRGSLEQILSFESFLVKTLSDKTGCNRDKNDLGYTDSERECNRMNLQGKFVREHTKAIDEKDIFISMSEEMFTSLLNLKTLPENVTYLGYDNVHKCLTLTCLASDEENIRLKIEESLVRMHTERQGYDLSKSSSFTTEDGLDVTVFKSNISKLNVDCIVNATSERLLVDFGISKAIANEAGYLYKDACKRLIEQENISLKPGECVVTEAGNLHCKKVIHATGTTYKGTDREHLSQLQSTIEACLDKADDEGFETIAFPTISTGKMGIDINLCAQQFYRAIKSFCYRRKNLRRVFIVDIRENNVRAVVKIFKRLF